MFKIEKSKKFLFMYAITVIIITIASTGIIINRIWNKTELQAFRDNRGKEEYERLEKITIERSKEYIYHFENGVQSKEVKTSSEVHYRNR